MSFYLFLSAFRPGPLSPVLCSALSHTADTHRRSSRQYAPPTPPHHHHPHPRRLNQRRHARFQLQPLVSLPLNL